MCRTKDSDSDHGLGPWSVRLIMSVGLGPRTRSDLLPRTRSAQKNRRLRNKPLMSDSVRGPRRLIGEFDVGLGPWSVVRGLSPSPNWVTFRKDDDKDGGNAMIWKSDFFFFRSGNQMFSTKERGDKASTGDEGAESVLASMDMVFHFHHDDDGSVSFNHRPPWVSPRASVRELKRLENRKGCYACIIIGEIKAVVIATGVHTFFGKAAHLVDSTNQVRMAVEIVVMYPIQKRSYMSGIDNLLVLLIGGIPIDMPTLLSVTVAIGSHMLSQAKDENNIA
ncbi:hypothetical protein LXL04_031910 [Taraxacum kok-saghyz]